MNTGNLLFAQLMDFFPGPRLLAASFVMAATIACASSVVPSSIAPWLLRN